MVEVLFPWERPLIDVVKRKMEGAPPSHDFSHVKRVVRLCDVIRREEGGDREVLRAAAWLHDVGRPLEEETGRDHAEIGAEIAEALLPELGFPEDKVREVVHAVEAHRYSTGPEPETLEAEILQDADNLDAMGAVGIARCFCVVGERGTSLADGVKHFHEKLLHLVDIMNTETARGIALRRKEKMIRFLDWLESETDGELGVGRPEG